VGGSFFSSAGWGGGEFVNKGELIDNPGPYKEGVGHLIYYSHKNKCKAVLSNFFNGKSANEKPDRGEFSIVAECLQEYVIGSDK